MFSKILTSLLVLLLAVPVAHACTAFVVNRDGLALAGNNEDFWLTDTKIWYVPIEGSKRGVAGGLGRVYFGFDNFYPQGGMNEAGLFFDGFATAENKLKNSEGKSHFEGNITDYVMANCKTVSEVVEQFEKHDLSFLANAMLMFGDQHGDSVIIEGDEFLRIEGDHQVVTNFYQSMTPSNKCPCSRYKTAVRSLKKGEPVSIESCRDVLAATRQNGGAPTQYSNVYDLKKGLVYLYHFHNFDEVVCINLKEELEKGAHEVDLPTMFSENKRFFEFQSKRRQDIIDQTEARKSTDIDPKTFKDYTGAYTFEVGKEKKVTANFWVKNEQLYAVSELDGKHEQIHPESKDHFFYIGDYGLQTVEFQRDQNDRVTEVLIFVFGRQYRGVKQK